MTHVRTLAAAMLVFIAATGYAADDPLRAKLAARLEKAFPEAKVTGIRPSEVPGIYEVMLGPSLLYISGDGRFVFRGDLYDLQEMRNLSAARRNQARVAAFASAGVDSMIEFAPAGGKAKHVIYVFTDIDCAYCRKMHKEITQLTRAGIAVRYLAFPRAGLDSESYEKAVAVWCSTDRQRALTEAKLGKRITAARCNNPVAAHFDLGEAMGVRGTPSVYAEDGKSIGGYVPARELIELLDSGEI